MLAVRHRSKKASSESLPVAAGACVSSWTAAVTRNKCRRRDVRRHDLLAPTSTAHASEPCKRRVTPRWKRTDVLLPLGVSGQGGAARVARGPRGHRPATHGRRWQGKGRISSRAELCNERVLESTSGTVLCTCSGTVRERNCRSGSLRYLTIIPRVLNTIDITFSRSKTPIHGVQLYTVCRTRLDLPG